MGARVTPSHSIGTGMMSPTLAATSPASPSSSGDWREGDSAHFVRWMVPATRFSARMWPLVDRSAWPTWPSIRPPSASNSENTSPVARLATSKKLRRCWTRAFVSSSKEQTEDGARDGRTGVLHRLAHGSGHRPSPPDRTSGRLGRGGTEGRRSGWSWFRIVCNDLRTPTCPQPSPRRSQRSCRLAHPPHRVNRHDCRVPAGIADPWRTERRSVPATLGGGLGEAAYALGDPQGRPRLAVVARPGSEEHCHLPHAK